MHAWHSPYRRRLALGKGGVDAVELQLRIDVLLLDLGVGGHVDCLGTHDGRQRGWVDGGECRCEVIYDTMQMGISGEKLLGVVA